MSTTPEPYEDRVQKEIQSLRDEELISFIRETVARLDALADRLEGFVQEAGEENELQ